MRHAARRRERIAINERIAMFVALPVLAASQHATIGQLRLPASQQQVPSAPHCQVRLPLTSAAPALELAASGSIEARMLQSLCVLCPWRRACLYAHARAGTCCACASARARARMWAHARATVRARVSGMNAIQCAQCARTCTHTSSRTALRCTDE